MGVSLEMLQSIKANGIKINLDNTFLEKKIAGKKVYLDTVLQTNPIMFITY